MTDVQRRPSAPKKQVSTRTAARNMNKSKQKNFVEGFGRTESALKYAHTRKREQKQMDESKFQKVNMDVLPDCLSLTGLIQSFNRARRRSSTITELRRNSLTDVKRGLGSEDLPIQHKPAEEGQEAKFSSQAQQSVGSDPVQWEISGQGASVNAALCPPPETSHGSAISQSVMGLPAKARNSPGPHTPTSPSTKSEKNVHIGPTLWNPAMSQPNGPASPSVSAVQRPGSPSAEGSRQMVLADRGEEEQVFKHLNSLTLETSFSQNTLEQSLAPNTSNVASRKLLMPEAGLDLDEQESASLEEQEYQYARVGGGWLI